MISLADVWSHCACCFVAILFLYHDHLFDNDTQLHRCLKAVSMVNLELCYPGHPECGYLSTLCPALFARNILKSVACLAVSNGSGTTGVC